MNESDKGEEDNNDYSVSPLSCSQNFVPPLSSVQMKAVSLHSIIHDDGDVEDSDFLSRASAPEISSKQQPQYQTIGHRRGRRRPRPGAVSEEEEPTLKSSMKTGVKQRRRSLFARFLGAATKSKKRNKHSSHASGSGSTASGDTGATGEVDASSATASDHIIDIASANVTRSNGPTSPMLRSFQQIVRRNTIENGLTNGGSVSSGRMNLEEYKATQARLQNWAGELLCYGKTDQAIEVWNDALELAEVQNDTLTNKTEILCMLVNLHFQVANQENDPLMLSKELSVNGMGDDDHENTNQEDISRRQLLARRQSKLIKPGLEEKYHRQQAKRYLHRIKAGLVQPAWLGPPTKALKDFFCEAEAWELAIIITDQLLFQNGQDQDCQQLATMHYHVASHKLDAQRHSEALQHLQATVTYLQKIPADARDMTLYLQVLHLLATEYHSQQQYDSALETYKEQMVHSPKAEKPSLHCQMAQVFIAKGELDRALEQIELAKRLEETSPDSIISQLLQTKGDVYCRLGRVEDSLECYQEALHETENSPPEKAKLLYTMGRLSVKIGRIRNAITYFTRELEITKQELGKNHLSVSRVLHELARLYDEGLGEHKMALMKYNKALHVELAVLEDCHRQISDCPNCNPVSHRMCTKHANLQRNISTRIRETKKSQGRIHYKLGDFERAMQASFVESPISSEQEKKKGRRRRTTHQLSY